MQRQLSLRYEGPAVDAGKMDVYEVAANLVAFSDFVVAAAQATYGQDVRVKADVAGFGKGSFFTDLIFQYGGPVASLLSAVSAGDLYKIIKESLDLWKHLGGLPPKEIKPEGNQFRVTNNNGQVINISHSTFNIVLNKDGAGEAVERFIRRPLEMPGIERVKIGDESGESSTILKSDAGSFTPVRLAEETADVEMRISLIIEAPTFKDGNKWRFSDGSVSFAAEIKDLKFLRDIDAGVERFGKGDQLVVRLRIRQVRTGMKLESIREVIEVLEHRIAPKQSSIDGT